MPFSGSKAAPRLSMKSVPCIWRPESSETEEWRLKWMGSGLRTGAPWTVVMTETTVVRVRAEENFMLTVGVVLRWKSDCFEVVLVLCRRLPEGET